MPGRLQRETLKPLAKGLPSSPNGPADRVSHFPLGIEKSRPSLSRQEVKRMTTDEKRRKEPTPKEMREGDMGEGSFSQTHGGQEPSPPNVKGPRHVHIPSKDEDG